ncbi:MAG: YciI family protein [Acidimicrobiia bacterium]
MRYIILVKATEATEVGEFPSQQLMGEVARFTEDLAKAGALYDATGLKPTSQGWRIRFRGGEREMRGLSGIHQVSAVRWQAPRDIA